MSVLLDALAVAAGSFAGGFAGAMTRDLRRRLRGPETPQAVCGCKHSLALHDPTTGRCSSTVGDWYWQEEWDEGAQELVNRKKWNPCPCRQYVGPRPIDSVFAPPMLPPSDLT